MYYSAIGLLAALILIIENQDILKNAKGSFEKPAWTVYRRFLYAVLVYYITDILWGILESRKLPTALFADTTVYFLAMAAGVFLWVQFTVSYLDEKSAFGQFLIYAGQAVALVIAAVTVVNIFLPVLFTVDSACVYQALPMRYVILAAQILLLLLISGYALSSLVKHPEESGRNVLAIAIFGFIMALCLFIQIWFPLLPFYSIAYMLGTSMLHTVVVNDEKEMIRGSLAEAEKIAELKQSITSLLNNMPGITYTKDAETGAYLACNQRFAEFAQKQRPEDVVGLKPAELFDPVTAGRGADEDRIALSMDVPYVFFEDVLDAAGKQRQLQTTKLKYTDTNGRLCVLGMSQDVTDLVRIRRENAMTKEAYEKTRSSGLIYTRIAQTLARGYTNLYYVNLDSEEFIEYQSDEENGLLNEVRRGYHFFEECQIEAEEFVHPEDRAAFKKALDRKTLVRALEKNKSFVLIYRLLKEGGGATYVTLKASRMVDDDRFIILGVTDTDEEVKKSREAERVREEQIAYARINALAGDFLAVYVIDPVSGFYREFSATENYETLEQAKAGRDFFGTTRKAAEKAIYADDLNLFLSAITEENVLKQIEENGIFTLTYRINLEGKTPYIQFKAAMVEEKEGRRLIVGLSNVDAQVRQEEKYVASLSKARMEASVDALTGVKNRHAYLVAEERMNEQIAGNDGKEFAVVILDVNDLKRVNDNEGHAAGDQYIRDACKIICDIFDHSPVFRVGGDEFAVIAQGSDYEQIDELVARVDERNATARQDGGVVIACGMAKREGDASVATVFERADQRMYENKNRLKS